MATVEQQPAAAGQNGVAKDHFAVINPATGETIAHVPDMGPDQVRALVAEARAAQPAWQELGFEGRAEVMHEAKRWLVDNRERVTQTIIDETGKAHEDAQIAEVFFVADSLSFWAKKASEYLADERVKGHAPLVRGKKLYVRYRPFGVIGVIGPWNYPLTNSFGDGIPALMAGNAVIFKPSEVTPLTTLLMQEGMKAAGLPDGVMQVATGLGPTGATVVDEADMIMFTGSVATGKKIMAKAAETLTPVSLELGGKDPMIVLRDADVDRAANAAVYWSMANGGQICMSIERVYVEEPIYDEFVGKVIERASKLRQGKPAGPGSVEVGAVTFPPQLDLIESHVNDAVEKGAEVRVGGKRRSGPGLFFEPTVLTGVDHSMRIMTEETFGPTLPIMKVRDEEEAVQMANDSRYGLNSSVWTKDIAKGERVAQQVMAGSTCVNDALTNYVAQELPMGGVRESGIGVRHSAKGIQKYCTSHSILVSRFNLKRELYWYPYTKRGTKMLERFMVLQNTIGSKRRGRGRNK